MTDTNGTPFVSVVVPALNCADEVEGFAACMRAQTYPADRFEVILVDNGSTDDTFERARRAGLAALKRTERGRSRALNTGVRASRGKYVLTTDISCRAAADWIESVVATFAAYPQAACVAGDIRLLETTRNAVIDFQKRTNYMSPLLALERTKLPFLPFADGANASFRKSLFDEIGGFEEDFIKAADVEICYRMLMVTKHSLVFNAHALVWEPGEENLKALLRQRFRMGIGTNLLRSKYPVLFLATRSSWSLRQRYWKLREAASELIQLVWMNFLALVGVRRNDSQDVTIRYLMGLAQSLGFAYGKRQLGRTVPRPRPIATDKLEEFLSAVGGIEGRIILVRIPPAAQLAPAVTIDACVSKPA